MNTIIYTLKNWMVVMIILIISFPPVMAQARYKHLPRVRIEKTRTEEKPVAVEKLTVPVTVEEPTIIQQELPPVTETALVTSAPENVILAPQKKSIPVNVKMIEEPEKANKDGFTEAVKKKSYLLEVKDVKKTNLIGYLLWFLVVLLLGIALFVLAFVFLGVIAYSLYYIFLVFGIAGLAIALLILIFGLTGIIA